MAVGSNNLPSHFPLQRLRSRFTLLRRLLHDATGSDGALPGGVRDEDDGGGGIDGEN